MERKIRKIETAALIPNAGKERAVECAFKIAEYFAGRSVRTLMQEEYSSKYSDFSASELLHGIRFMPYPDLLDFADIAVVCGGDGTILRTAHHAIKRSIPILGVNLGKIGYMAGLEYSELKKLSGLWEGFCAVEDRSTVRVSLNRGGRLQEEFHAVNDATVSRGAMSRMIEVYLYCDGQYIARYRADGLIIATPTGSTAYSLSAGGPIVDPKIGAVSVTPICPYLSLNGKTILFSDTSELRVRLGGLADREAYLSVDACENLKLEDGDELIFTKSPYPFRMVKLKDKGFFEIYREKTGMGVED